MAEAGIETYIEEGLAQMDAGRYEQAIATFTKALRLSLGDLAEIFVYRGSAYAYLSDWEAALADFNQALHMNSQMADAYNERGCLLRFQGDLEGAVADHTAAITIDPQHAEAYYNRALAHEAAGDDAQAEADLTAAIRLKPELTLAYELRGNVRVRLLNISGAITDLQQYLALGGGREYDNQSEIRSQLLSLRISHLLRRLLRMKH